MHGDALGLMGAGRFGREFFVRRAKQPNVAISAAHTFMGLAITPLLLL
jgi:hypothetical protein